jgi:hypothetical protein
MESEARMTMPAQPTRCWWRRETSEAADSLRALAANMIQRRSRTPPLGVMNSPEHR